MNQQYRNPLLLQLAIAFTVLTSHATAAVTLIDKTFDGNNTNDIGSAFQQLTNGVGTGGSSNTTTGVVTTGSGNVNSNYGFNNISLTTIPVGTTSITATFVISSAPASVSTLAANGLFFGIVSGTDATNNGSNGLYQSQPRSFGYIAGSTNWGDHGIGQDLNETNNTIFTQLSNTPTNASFADGFTVSITMNSNDTWSIITTGLSTNATGTGGYTGTLNTGAAGFNFATFISGGVGLNTSLQNGGMVMEIDQMTLTAIPEPSTAMLVGAVGTLALLRRRRC